MRVELMNSLVLAYIGDAVLEVKVRDYLVHDKNIAKVNDLQKTAIRYVSAKSHAAYIKALKETPELLSEEEWQWYHRGRNSKGRHRVKNTDVQTHNESSGFEAIIGALHELDRSERINEIFDHYVKFVEDTK